MLLGDYMTVVRFMKPAEYIASYINQTKLENLGSTTSNSNNNPVETSFPLEIYRLLHGKNKSAVKLVDKTNVMNQMNTLGSSGLTFLNNIGQELQNL